ncbi:hypothetical protein GLE_5417 [Lysobacter enzymogenes]|uniref:Uncharacterized protein n=1 Tax=Lysobacter enzymogenes TaxID=69 RepID=A0A0S2DQ59_LYSEN|nr:hypothetical protein GLE_5417 [Lysobacter enzymogenes]
MRALCHGGRAGDAARARLHRIHFLARAGMWSLAEKHRA